MFKTFYFFLSSLVKYAQSVFISLLCIFLGLSWAFLVTNPYYREFKCDRIEGYCEIINSDFLKNIKNTERFKIEDINELTIQQEKGRARKGRTYYYDQGYIKTDYKNIAISQVQYNSFKKFYEEKLDKIYSKEQEIVSFIIGLLISFLGLIGFIYTCKNIRVYYLEKLLKQR